MSGFREEKVEAALGVTPEDDQKFSFEAEQKRAATEQAETQAEEVETPAAEAPAAEAKAEEAGQSQEAEVQTPTEEKAPEKPAEDGEAQAVVEQDSKEQEPELNERKPRAQRRIEDLNAKLRQSEQERLELLQKLNQAPQYPNGQSPQLPNYEGRETVDPSEIQKDVVQTANQIAQEAIRRELANRDARDAAKAKLDTFQSDLAYITKEYDVLNDQSPNYDPQLDEFLSRQYETASDMGRNGLRLKDFIDGHMVVAETLSEKRQAAQTAAVAKQAAETAVTPSSGTAKPPERPFHELSDEEMEAKLGWAK